MFAVCTCCSTFSMFSFDRSDARVTSAGLGAGFCACAGLPLTRRMASKAKATPVCFMVVFSLKCARSAPSFIQTPPPRASFVFGDYGLLRGDAAKLDFCGKIGIHQGRAAVRCRTNLLRRDSQSAAQIRARQVRAIHFNSA